MGPRILKAISMLLRVLQLLLALFIVGVASFHVYQFSNSHLRLTNGPSGQIPSALYAIEVISCVAAIYTFLTLVITCLGHKKFFIFAVIFDLLFTGGFIAISILMRGSTKQECSNINYSGNTSKGTNDIPSSLYSTSTINSSNVKTSSSPKLICNLDKVSFSLAVALSFFFAITLFLSYLALRAYQKHRAFGPSPANNYSTRNNGAHKSWANPFHRASEETAYTSNTAMTGTTAGGYDAPGFRGASSDAGYRTATPGNADVAATYRTPVTSLQDNGYRGSAFTASELDANDNGRFDPSLMHGAHTHTDPRYVERGYGGQNF